MQQIYIAGRVGRDPESRFTTNNLKVTNFSVAVNIRGKGKEEVTVWWRVTVWGDRFDKMLSFIKKGSAIMVFGEVGKPEIYTDKEGRPQVNLEITVGMNGGIFFSPFGKPDSQGEQQQQQQGVTNSYGNQTQNNYSAAQSNYNQMPAQQAGGIGSFDHFAASESNRAPFNGSNQVTSGQSMQNHETNEDPLPF